MAGRLRRSDCSGPGIARRRRGRGFEYRDGSGELVRDQDTLARVRTLAIPPAWTDVWICRDPLGRLQATGVDAAGRKQYRYHDRWLVRRDAAKFDEMLDFARALPALRRAVTRELAGEDLGRERVLACALRLLDIGFFRIGSEEYAEENRSYGLATMRKEHVTLDGDVMTFDYPAKSGQRRVQEIVDPVVGEIVRGLKRRRGGKLELLAYRDETGRWRDVKSDEINEHVKELTGGDATAKDFRTWSATVLAAVELAKRADEATTKTSRKRLVTTAVREVAAYLGNTPAVARASYVDPRVIDRFHGGWTIAERLAEIAASEDPGDVSTNELIEDAVLDLIGDPRGSEDVERIAACWSTRIGKTGPSTRRCAPGSSRHSMETKPSASRSSS